MSMKNSSDTIGNRNHVRKMGNGAVSPDEKRPECGAGHPLTSIAKIKKEYSNTSSPLWAFRAVYMKIFPSFGEACFFSLSESSEFNTRNALRYENFRLPKTLNYIVRFPVTFHLIFITSKLRTILFHKIAVFFNGRFLGKHNFLSYRWILNWQ